MSRIIANDFDRLMEYIRTYSVTDEIQNAELRKELKKGHKHYLPLLYLWSRVDSLSRAGALSLSGKIIIDAKTTSYLEESISDIAGSFTCCIHGNYKPAFMLLRSSIENYLRFFTSNFNGDAKTTTVISHLFEISKTTPIFQDPNNNYLTLLKQIYGELCAYTHTASPDNMTKIHAISHFPRFNAKDFKKWNGYALRIASIILQATLLANKTLYLSAHFKTKEVFEDMLPSSLCAYLNGSHQ
ncbi:hypothetical protein ABR855_12430 [Aeromonas hydrophila]|uniref:hypothetical protein n=1 Tax=Aeromonas hydrophila TaxID=644 RepID=UPI001C76D93E|nr:hypothetical protein HQ396_07900 [Aeromonas hydrophila]